MKSKELKEIQNAAARKWFDNKTNENANNVIRTWEPYLRWFAKRKSIEMQSQFSKEEYYCEAAFGLYEALLKYNGVDNFSSYATFWIIYRIQLFNSVMVSDLNYGRCDKRMYLLKHYKRLYAEFKHENPEASIDEIHKMIAEKINSTVRVVERVYWEKQPNLRLDAEISNNGDSKLNHDIIQSDYGLTEENIIDFIDAQKMKKVVNERFKKFNQQKMDILYKCVVEGGGYEDLAKKYGVSRQAIEQKKKRIEKSFERFKRAMR